MNSRNSCILWIIIITLSRIINQYIMFNKEPLGGGFLQPVHLFYFLLLYYKNKSSSVTCQHLFCHVSKCDWFLSLPPFSLFLFTFLFFFFHSFFFTTTWHIKKLLYFLIYKDICLYYYPYKKINHSRKLIQESYNTKELKS